MAKGHLGQGLGGALRGAVCALALGWSGMVWAADPAGAPANTAGGPYEVFGLHSDDMLVIRAAADVLSAPLGWVAYDARDVMVLEVSGDAVWGRVQREETTGWVLLRHLREPAR